MSEPICKVYAFEFTDCYHESAHAVVSLHTTKRGALKAMVAYVNERCIEQQRNQYRLTALKPMQFERWRVREIEVLSDSTTRSGG